MRIGLDIASLTLKRQVGVIVLIAGDSDFEWAQFLIGKGILDRDLYEAKNVEFYEQYKAGTLDIDVFLDFQLQPLSRYPRALLDTWQREFLSRHIVPLVSDKARALVRKHLDHGALCAIVTATNEFVTRPIADAFGVPDLMAVELEMDTTPGGSGWLTGAIRGVASAREGKVVRFDSWLAERGLTWADVHVTFYSDSTNDLPLLERAHAPVATNPDARLRATAQARGWRILDLFPTTT